MSTGRRHGVSLILEESSERTGPLAGIRILDLTKVIMGPFATQVLADQGADVILVEESSGDINRVIGAGRHAQLSGTSMNLLRNKRSAAIDLKTIEGQELLGKLVRTCDVVVTAMRPQAVEKLHLDYATLRGINPRIIFCQAQGFNLDSESANEPAYDDIIQAASGVSDIMERVWGEPALVPTIFADKVCGLIIAHAITAALVHRERTNEGQHVEVAMRQAMSAFMLVEHGDGAILEPPVPATQPGQPATGYKRLLSRERRPHPTKDGQIHLFPYLPRHYALLFSEAGVANAEDDPRYVDRRTTLINSDSLYRDVREIAITRTTAEWLAYCKKAGIPATKVNSLQDLVDELPIATHPAVGHYRLLPTVANFSGAATGFPSPAPLIGEHTDEILAEAEELLSGPPSERGSGTVERGSC
jgi:crotonobetainyl-CoA:carnitine CoA-transferase CaiB-like acyl-CoA transferase